MNITRTGPQNAIAHVTADTVLITDAQSALDLIATVSYETGSHRIILDKAAFAEAFFDLRTGLAGEVSQKCVNYHMRLAIVGDFSVYSSKALRDYIYECNQGRSLYFAATLDEAVTRLG